MMLIEKNTRLGFEDTRTYSFQSDILVSCPKIKNYIPSLNRGYLSTIPVPANTAPLLLAELILINSPKNCHELA
jgi:hypothetical protein